MLLTHRLDEHARSQPTGMAFADKTAGEWRTTSWQAYRDVTVDAGEVVAVGVVEPGDPSAVGCGPDAALVLAHAVVAIEVDTRSGEAVDLTLEVFEDPTENRVGRCAHLLHSCDAKLACGGVVDEGKGPRVGEVEAEDAPVEPLGSVQIAHPDETNLLGTTEHRDPLSDAPTDGTVPLQHGRIPRL